MDILRHQQRDDVTSLSSELLCWLLLVWESQSAKRAHQRKTARRRDQAAVIKVLTMASKAHPEGLPAHIADALRGLCQLVSLPRSRTPSELMHRSTDPELSSLHQGIMLPIFITFSHKSRTQIVDGC